MADQRKDVKMKDRLKTLKIYGIQIYLLFEKGYMKTMNLSDPPEGKLPAEVSCREKSVMEADTGS